MRHGMSITRCHQIKIQMSIFKHIDLEIEAIGKKLNAKISKDRPGYPESLRTFEERRIDWKDNGINKAIVIQPTFENEGVNSELWNFRLIAWKGSRSKRKYVDQVIEKSDFKIIESNINELLESGTQRLLEITEEHLK